ncbi:MAG: hypothetical protein KKF80_07650 [Candidatus Omnitrophica bacterium]|nr:hypothetical protein [Candidatus Omnitrophota bacterium]
MIPFICFAEEPAIVDVAAPRIINNNAYILYVPGGMKADHRYPLVVALSPNAHAESMLGAWKDVSERYKWIILASREHKNGMDFKVIGSALSSTIRAVVARYPVDEKKIIATGFSGGGMSAHYLSMAYPNLISAVVVNTAMINEYYFGGKHYGYPRNKIAVFLASPTDFRYEQMKLDRNFLERIGWKTRWIEFEGGHAIAPAKAYQEAAVWLIEELH